MSRLVRPLVLGLITCFSLTIVSAIPVAERQALIAFYNALNGGEWYSNHNWLGPEGTEGTWLGVTVTNDHVTAIMLQGMGLEGAIPPEIGDLLYLEVLDVYAFSTNSWVFGLPNHVTGLPPEVGLLPNLRVLNLGHNTLSVLPDEIGDLVSLTALDLSGTGLTAVPPAVTAIQHLQELSLGANTISVLPSSIGNLVSLRILDLSSNDLVHLPSQIGLLTHLVELRLGDNPLADIPAEMSGLPNLERLEFAGHRAANLPAGLGLLKNVKELYVSSSVELTDLSEISNMTGLEILTLHAKLRSLPASFAQLTNVRALDLSGNRLPEIPVVLGELRNLEQMDLSENPLEGSVPAALGQLSLLKELILRRPEGYETRLSGNLPPELGNMTGLEVLALEGDFTGPVPPELGRLHNLTELELYGMFSSIPGELGQLVNLRRLVITPDDWDSATLAPFDTIPHELGNLVNLEELALSGSFTSVPPELTGLNQLKVLALTGESPGPIPTGIGQLNNLIQLGLHGGFTGTIPSGIGQLTALRNLDLSDNLLSGPIPVEIGNLSLLKVLFLNHNRLDGPIPEEVWGLTTLDKLDFSYNRLTGTVSKNLANVPAWEIDLSHNRLEGAIPLEVLEGQPYVYRVINLSANRLVGPLPAGLKAVEHAWNWVDLKWNALYAVGLDAFEFVGLHHLGDFVASQSYSPVNLAAEPTGDSVRLTWSPIPYSTDSGGYQILYRKTPDEPYSLFGTTPTKTTNTFTVTGLETGVNYQFAIRTVTYPNTKNENTVIGDPGNYKPNASVSGATGLFPAYREEPGSFTGFSVTNLAASEMTADFQARGEAGSLAGLPRNPVSVKIKPGRQLVALGNEIFGGTPGTNSSWVILKTDRSLATLAMIGTGQALDGTVGLTETSPVLYFPQIYEGEGVAATKSAVTRLNLANPGPAPAQVRVRLFGATIDTTEVLRSIPPGGLLSETMGSLFGPGTIAGGFLEVSVLEGDPIAGLAVVTIGGQKSLFVVPGLPPRGDNRLIAAQVASGPQIASSVGLMNTDTVAHKVTFRLFLQGNDSPLEASRSLNPGGFLQQDVGELFELGENLTAGSLEVVAAGSGVLGNILINDPSFSFATAVNLEPRASRSAVFAYVANGLGVFTGLAVFNPSEGSADVKIEVFAADGRSQGSFSLTLAPRERLAKLTAEIIPSSGGLVGGYIRILSSEPVVAEALFAADSLDYMSCVPAVVLQ